MPAGLSITAVVVSILVGVFAVSGPFSQGGASAARVANFDGVWTTGWQVQNLDASKTATITATYYDVDGTVVRTDSRQVDPLSGHTFYPLPVASGFQGSVVVQSDTEIAAVANLLRQQPSEMSGSYLAISATSEIVYVPLLQRNNGGTQSELHIQNAASEPVTVTVAFKPSGLPGRSTTEFTTDPQTIQPGASYRIDQTTQTALDGPDENGNESDRWVGSATITSVGGPVGAIVNQSDGEGLMSYSGFHEGGAILYAPLVQDLNGAEQWVTGIQLQNIGDTESTVTATVDGVALEFGNEATCVNPDNANELVIPAGSPCTIFPLKFNRAELDNRTPFKFGGAIFEGSSDSQLVGIVNQISTVGVAQQTAYGMFTSAGANEIFLPLLQHNNPNDQGYVSGIAVMNTGSDSVSITLSDPDGLVGSVCHYADERPGEELTIQPGESCIIYPILQGSRDGETGYTRAGRIGAPPGSTLQVIVNQVDLTSPPGDTFMTYEGFRRRS